MKIAEHDKRTARRSVPEPGGTIKAYCEGMALAPVAVVRDGTLLRAASGPQLTADAAVIARWWCRRGDDAARVGAAAAARLRRFALPGSEPTPFSPSAIDAITDAARRLGIVLYSDADIAADAAALAERIDAEIRRQQACGALKTINRSYRAYRLAASARGEKIKRYDEWMRIYRDNLVRQAAAALRQL